MSKKIEKHFPSQVHRGQKKGSPVIKDLFLYNKKLDALLYAYLQERSVPVEVGIDQNGKRINQTRVWKSELPIQKKICQSIRISSTKTYRNRLQALQNYGYLKQTDEYFVLLNPQKTYLPIPLETLKFLIDATNSEVIKVYIYLGQGHRMAIQQHRKYIFTKKQLINAISIHEEKGKESKSQYEVLDNILICLKNNGLIDYEDFQSGKVTRMRLIDFNLNYTKR